VGEVSDLDKGGKNNKSTDQTRKEKKRGKDQIPNRLLRKGTKEKKTERKGIHPMERAKIPSIKGCL